MVFNFCITLAVNSMIIIACYTSWSVYTVGNRRKSLLHNAQSFLGIPGVLRGRVYGICRFSVGTVSLQGCRKLNWYFTQEEISQ